MLCLRRNRARQKRWQRNIAGGWSWRRSARLFKSACKWPSRNAWLFKANETRSERNLARQRASFGNSACHSHVLAMWSTCWFPLATAAPMMMMMMVVVVVVVVKKIARAALPYRLLVPLDVAP